MSWPRESIRHSLARKGIKTGKRVGVKGKTTTKTTKVIQDRINTILFKPTKQQSDSELLEITVRSDKAKYFDFLKGFTSWKTKGRWHKLDEKNTLIEVQYKDMPDERIGKELVKLLGEYNDKVVKEDLLYVRTTQLEDTSLK